MPTTRHLVLIPIIACLVGGCSHSQPAASRPAAHPVSPASQANTTATQREAMLTAFAAPDEQVARVAVSADAPFAGAMVTYADKDGSVCTLSIYEMRAAKMIKVAESRGLIYCSTIPATEIAAAQVSLQVWPGRIALQQEGAHNHNEFELVRTEGEWRVQQASYTRARVDDATGDMVVDQEKAAFAGNGPSVSGFSYQVIEPALVRSTIK